MPGVRTSGREPRRDAALLHQVQHALRHPQVPHQGDLHPQLHRETVPPGPTQPVYSRGANEWLLCSQTNLALTVSYVSNLLDSGVRVGERVVLCAESIYYRGTNLRWLGTNSMYQKRFHVAPELTGLYHRPRLSTEE